MCIRVGSMIKRVSQAFRGKVADGSSVISFGGRGTNHTTRYSPCFSNSIVYLYNSFWRNVRLLDKFQRLQELDKRDREAVIILIDGVLARRAVESAIAATR